MVKFMNYINYMKYINEKNLYCIFSIILILVLLYLVYDFIKPKLREGFSWNIGKGMCINSAGSYGADAGAAGKKYFRNYMKGNGSNCINRCNQTSNCVGYSINGPNTGPNCYYFTGSDQVTSTTGPTNGWWHTFDCYKNVPLPLPVGPTGPAGPAGPAGPEGKQGPAGLVGKPGQAGPPGQRGDAGPKGSIGQAGVAGPAGPTGATGAFGKGGKAGVGPSGPPGPKGDKGDTGNTGDTGGGGPAGSIGSIGTTGPPGPQGATGPAGPQGTRGTIGTTVPTTITQIAPMATAATGSSGNFSSTKLGELSTHTQSQPHPPQSYTQSQPHPLTTSNCMTGCVKPTTDSGNCNGYGATRTCHYTCDTQNLNNLPNTCSFDSDCIRGCPLTIISTISTNASPITGIVPSTGTTTSAGVKTQPIPNIL